MENRRVTISDIAQELGLSTATVSNVIHGKTRKISDITVQRVQALLEERQYIPSMAGILLAQNSSRIIGVVVNDHEKYESHTLEDVFVAASLNCLSAEIEKNGQFMMVKKTTEPEQIIKFASMWNLDGLVLLGFCDEDYMYLRNHMRIPFVVYDGFCDCSQRIYNITIDNYSGGYQVGEYFRKGGHKHVMCLADNDVCVDKERYEGFCAGFGADGVEKLIVPMRKAERRRFYEDSVTRLCSVSAIFAVSDHYAIELIHFLKEHNISVPGQISVAGFDDTPMCQMVSPSLTSVHQDIAQRAKIALLKIQQLRDGTVQDSSIILPVTLVVRKSTRTIYP